MTTEAKSADQTDNFPLADDESQGSSLDTGGRAPLPAQPLPRDEGDDQEEKARLIAQVLELQNTLDGIF
ncbi:unnamed protein product [Gongylonema pulchrum]|uniref:Flagellar motor switch protein FliN n=1 Tax=Gongylonema pulchrum TaxID=637853 RepID=A0A183DYX4_9BILA|nr:unnamed protein product [Gongylonema pulchrum]